MVIKEKPKCPNMTVSRIDGKTRLCGLTDNRSICLLEEDAKCEPYNRWLREIDNT